MDFVENFSHRSLIVNVRAGVFEKRPDIPVEASRHFRKTPGRFGPDSYFTNATFPASATSSGSTVKPFTASPVSGLTL